jgi:hypothetical protein
MTDRLPPEPQDPNATSPYYPPPGYGYPGSGHPGYGATGSGGDDRTAYPPAYPGYSGYPGYPPPPPPVPAGYARAGLRPGSVTSAAALSFAAAALMIMAALLLIASAAALNNLGDLGTGTSSYPTDGELAVDGLVDLAAAALLVAGGVKLLARNPAGRTLIYLGAGVIAANALYWLLRVDALFDLFWVVVFCAPVATAVCLAASATTRSWLSRPGEQRAPAPPGTGYGPPGSGGAHL